MIRIVSTDFDGTIHDPYSSTLAIAPEFLQWITQAQARGVKWVINTGRMLEDVSAMILSESMPTLPDYIVSVEREIHQRRDQEFVSHDHWNRSCHVDHQTLFEKSSHNLEEIRQWLNANFEVHVYEDPWSPLCMIAAHLEEADRIHAAVRERFPFFPGLCLVRNSVYFRFAHEGYSKGTALSEIARLLGIGKGEIFAAGDHYNDLSMLDGSHAQWVAAPSNAIPEIKDLVGKVGGFLAHRPYGWGVLDGLNHFEKEWR